MRLGNAEVLARVYNMLEVSLLHRKMKSLYEQVVAQQKVSERLLLNVLPKVIADRLKDQGGAAPSRSRASARCTPASSIAGCHTPELSLCASTQTSAGMTAMMTG